VAMAHYVGGHSPGSQLRKARGRPPHGLAQQIRDRLARQGHAVSVFEGTVFASSWADDSAQGRCRFRPEGTDTFFPALALQPHLPRPFQPQVAGARRQSLAFPRPGAGRSLVVDLGWQGAHQESCEAGASSSMPLTPPWRWRPSPSGGVRRRGGGNYGSN